MNGVKTLRFRVKSISREFGLRNFWINAVGMKAQSDVYYKVHLVPIEKPYGLLLIGELDIETQFPMEIDQIVSFEGGF